MAYQFDCTCHMTYLRTTPLILHSRLYVESITSQYQLINPEQREKAFERSQHI